MTSTRSRIIAWAAAGALLASAGGIGLVRASGGASGSVMTAIAPCRLLDTRVQFAIGGRSTPLAAGETITLRVVGSNGDCVDLPAGITAVQAQLTASDATGDSHLTAYPADAAARPNISQLNIEQGAVRSNNATVMLSASGEFKLFNNAGDTNVIIDILGVFVPGAGAVGPAGPQGDTGAPGAVGPQGAVGPAGPKGDTGAPGADGPAGSEGLAGADGPVGPEGPDGPDGPVGPEGPEGPVGPIGPEGPVGPVGPVGPAGADGPEGPIGPQGLPGGQGPQGPQGPQGVQGPAGTPAEAATIDPVVVVTASSTAAKNVTATCASGRLATGGGYAISPASARPFVIVNGPTAAFNGWQISTSGFRNAFSITVYAICENVTNP